MSSPDDLLRDALRDAAGTSSPAANAWSKVRDRAGAIRRRRRVVERGTALLAAAAIASAVVVATDVFGGDEHTIATPPSTGEEIVAVQGPNNGGDALVVLSADDGHLIRTLTEDIGITFGGISVTPDGETVYFARRRTALPCDRIEIAKVSRDGGDVEVIGAGIHPLVSPDGRTLAYARPAGGIDQCKGFGRIAFLDLASGVVTEQVVTDESGLAQPLAWSPDSTELAIGGSHGEERWPIVWTLDMPKRGVLAEIDIPRPADDAAYLPDGRLVVVFQDAESGHSVVAFDTDGLSDGTFSALSLLEASETGVLHLSAPSSSGEVLLHFGGDLLKRWQPGDAQATTIATDIGDAAWLPQEQAPPPDVTTTTAASPPASITAPNNLVVARSDRRVEVINADGSVVRSIGTASLDYHTLALAPDGVTLYYEQGGTDRCSAGAEIGRVRIDEDPLEFEHLVNGSFMSLSPDGTKLAYRDGACGIGGLVVRDLETGEQRGFHVLAPVDGGPSPELVGPVGWDAVGEHLMVRVNREPFFEFWYVDLPTDDDALSGPQYGSKGEEGSQTGPTDFAPLGTTGRWAAVVAAVGGPSLAEYDLDANESVRPLAELPDFGARIAGSDATGQHLLLLVPSERGFDLYRWSGGAVTTLVAEGITAADW